MSPIGRKRGEQWAIRLQQKLPKLAPTWREIAPATDNLPFLGLIYKIGTNFGSTLIIVDNDTAFFEMWLISKKSIWFN